MIYRVKRLMMYDGVQLERGAIWTPSGHANDAAIIRSGMVYEEAVASKTGEVPSGAAPEDEENASKEEITAPPVRRGRPPREG